jgi:hypothetical protein
MFTLEFIYLAQDAHWQTDASILRQQIANNLSDHSVFFLHRNCTFTN